MRVPIWRFVPYDTCRRGMTRLCRVPFIASNTPTPSRGLWFVSHVLVPTGRLRSWRQIECDTTVMETRGERFVSYSENSTKPYVFGFGPGESVVCSGQSSFRISGPFTTFVRFFDVQRIVWRQLAARRGREFSANTLRPPLFDSRPRSTFLSQFQFVTVFRCPCKSHRNRPSIRSRCELLIPQRFILFTTMHICTFLTPIFYEFEVRSDIAGLNCLGVRVVMRELWTI